MKSILMLVFTIFLLCGGCKKDEPEKLELPPYTQQGNNILACKINGNIFIAQGKQSDFGPSEGIDYSMRNQDSLITIDVIADEPYDADIILNFNYSKNKPSKLINTWENHAYLRMPVPDRLLAQSEYETNKQNTGTVEVKYFQNNIIAGTFEFDAVSDYGDTVHVTEGRFDLTTK